MNRRWLPVLLLLGANLLSSRTALHAGDDEPPIPHGQSAPPGPPLSPDEAIKKMQVPAGFSVELVAAEPDIVNPVAMTFDERGRAWITESLEYPRLEPGVGRDRVKILEDTDGDGRMDKFTVFADGLNIPSGIAVGGGGVWVANAPDLLFLQDTDGDDKADKTEVVLTGFGRTDTHELPNSLTWGPDGWLYGLNGVFNYSDITYRGVRHQFTCALFRIHPKTRAFELFAQGTSNPWGIAWDSEGSAFLSACVIDHLWHLTETGYYESQSRTYPPFTWQIGSIVEHKHQQAAYCGIHYYDSDAYPEQFRNKLYMGNIHGNCLNSDRVERAGSTYFGHPEPDFLSAHDAWFMPVAQKTGPDGCLYVLDWYDRYHCYQDARRDAPGIDRLKGRLYRIRYQETPRAPRFDMSQETDEQLIARLHGGNGYARDIAQRLLGERTEASTSDLLTELALSNSATRTARLHALWALISRGPLEAGIYEKLLRHDDATFRAWGVRAAGEAAKAGQLSDTVRRAIHERAADPSPDVRLQVAVAARKLEGDRAIPLLLSVLNQAGDDQLIPQIVWQNLHPLLEDHAAEFLAIAKATDLTAHPHLAGIMPRAVERVLGRRDPDPVVIVELFTLLAQGTNTDPVAARKCLAMLSSKVQNREIAGDELLSLRAALQPLIQPILAGPQDGPFYFDAALLSTSWKDASGSAAVRAVFADPGHPDARRLQALSALIAAADLEALSTVNQVLSHPEQSSLELRRRTIAALGRLDDPNVGKLVLHVYDHLDAEVQPEAVELLTGRASWSKQLLAAIAAKKLPESALNLNQVRKLLASSDAELVKQVAATWGTLRTERNPAREEVIAQQRQFIRRNPGDPHRGQETFKKVCGQCHKIHGEGQDVGPDITRNGRGSFDQLLSNVFDPSLVIGASYQARTVVTEDGRILTGLVAEDSDQRIVLRVQGGKQEVIARDDIAETELSKLSLMPEDLEKQLTPAELADLFAFITLDLPPGDPNAQQLPGVREPLPRTTENPAEFNAIVSEVAPGFTLNGSGEAGVELLAEHLGRRAVVRTHPLNEKMASILSRTLEIPAGKKARLVVVVGHAPDSDWQLLIRAKGQTLHDSIVGPETSQDGWRELEIDLSSFAGKPLHLELHNHPNNWSYEFGYWGLVQVVISD